MPSDLAPLSPAMHVGALLMHVTNSLTQAVPHPLGLTTDGAKVLLLEGQRLRASSGIDVPDHAPDLVEVLRDAAVRILDEVQDLLMSVTRAVWPDGPASHPAAGWTDRGVLRLGYYPSGDVGRAAVLSVPDYRPPTGPPRPAG